MKIHYRLELFSLLNCLSDIMDWISPELDNHHKQVAMISFRIAEEMNFGYEDLNDLVCAGILHDIGAISLEERLKLSRFEHEDPTHHAEVGYRLLKIFKPLRRSAEMVRYHHTPWVISKNDDIPIGGRIMMLADHIATMIDRKRAILGQGEEIIERIKKGSGTTFAPEVVDGFLKAANRESFWLDATSPVIERLLSNVISMKVLYLSKPELLSFANFIRRMIDFRSPFTATHSAGVAAVASELGRLMSMSEHDCFEIKVAGYLHDLGKLAIPKEILEKPDKLTVEEFNYMRAHTYYTYRALESVDDLQHINRCASFHHEHLDGKGYPFRVDKSELSVSARIMAVADVFTAITEDRPYRKGMKEPMIVLDAMMGHKLDTEVIKLLKTNLDSINQVRTKAQQESVEEYNIFNQNISKP
jgi:HD-GYP domain-containing protein (c-di-GMP phosphodiesterase class II)